MSESRLLGGRYRLDAELGRGGMGVVWLGRDTVLERDVAVKELRLPEGVDAAVVAERMLREARSAARVSHTHVVEVHDFVTEGDRPWIVMEYIRGHSLGQLIEESGPLPPARAAGIGVAVLDALVAAHQAGILHRDVKPSNILLGEDGRVVLTDFGIARLAGDSTLTASGTVLGSPGYMAPEQAGSGGPRPESDLWALGATLYAAVEGRSPFSRDSTMAVLAAVINGVPDPHTRAGELGPVLDAVLRKDPGQRPSPDRLRDMLVAVRDGAPVARTTVPLPVDLPVKNGWTGVAVAIGVAAVVVALIAGLVVFALNQKPPPAVLPGTTPTTTTGLTTTTTTTTTASENLVKVPPLAGLDNVSAFSTLNDEGLNDAVVSKSSPTVPFGTVIGSDPPAGTMVKKGSRVRVFLSCGEPSDLCK